LPIRTLSVDKKADDLRNLPIRSVSIDKEADFSRRQDKDGEI
jgi:hypothetical protein